MATINPPSEAYRALRQSLLVRLSLAAGALIVLGAVAVAWVPHRSSSAVPIAPQPMRSDRAPAPKSVPMAIRPASSSPQSALAEVMSDISAPESLEGKTLEVFPRRESTPGTGGEPEAVPDGKPPAPPPAKLPKGPHLQVGIFAQPNNAEEFRRALEAEGYPAYIETRVHVGPFANRREAERARAKLKSQGRATIFIAQ